MYYTKFGHLELEFMSYSVNIIIFEILENSMFYPNHTLEILDTETTQVTSSSLFERYHMDIGIKNPFSLCISKNQNHKSKYQKSVFKMS